MRRWFWKWVRFFLFRFDAETAHRVVIGLLRMKIFLGRGTGTRRTLGSSITMPSEGSPIRTANEVLGLSFRSRIGLAAGFDKNAEILPALPGFGFGFVEIGTVTPRPQPGNDPPRVFRDVKNQAIFNRMGFNGLGATLIADRLRKAKIRLPENFRIGVNIGKNRMTPLEGAAQDYSNAAKPFEGLADYLIINVSSPNTPGLRSLQTVDALRPIVDAVGSVITKWEKRPPLLLKLAPELKGESLAKLISAAEGWGIDGWVLTNTREGQWKTGEQTLSGGWSGAVLTADSRDSLVEARKLTRRPIISVGGIMSVEEALRRFSLGADLIEIYSGWIFQGPSFPAAINAKAPGRSPGLL